MQRTRPLDHGISRIKLLKAGFNDKEIEKLYIIDKNIEIIGVHWCNCRRCR